MPKEHARKHRNGDVFVWLMDPARRRNIQEHASEAVSPIGRRDLAFARDAAPLSDLATCSKRPCYDETVSPIHGIVPAMITPFGQDERIDYAAWQSLIDRLIAAGVDALFCGGSSGEFFALDFEERQVTLRSARSRLMSRSPAAARRIEGPD